MAFERKETGLTTLEDMRYRAPFVAFDPRSYDAYWEKHKYPHKYLDAVGIELVCEMVLNQYSPKQIAQVLQVSQVLLKKWIEADPVKEKQWEWALNHEADNQIFEARDILASAPLVPEALNKAEKQANHLRAMAKGFGTRRWGQKVDVKGDFNVATVSYSFNIALTQDQKQAIESTAKLITEEKPQDQVIDFKELIGSGLNAVDITVPEEDLNATEAKAIEQK